MSGIVGMSRQSEKSAVAKLPRISHTDLNCMIHLSTLPPNELIRTPKSEQNPNQSR